MLSALLFYMQFQSTPPMREATQEYRLFPMSKRISIHASHTDGKLVYFLTHPTIKFHSQFLTIVNILPTFTGATP